MFKSSLGIQEEDSVRRRHTGKALLLFIVDVLENDGCKQHLVAIRMQESQAREFKPTER